MDTVLLSWHNNTSLQRIGVTDKQLTGHSINQMWNGLPVCCATRLPHCVCWPCPTYCSCSRASVMTNTSVCILAALHHWHSASNSVEQPGSCQWSTELINIKIPVPGQWAGDLRTQVSKQMKDNNNFNKGKSTEMLKWYAFLTQFLCSQLPILIN